MSAAVRFVFAPRRELRFRCMLGSVAKFRVRERRTRSGAVHWYIDVEDVREVLGHTDLRTTEKYARHESGRLVPLVRGNG